MLMSDLSGGFLASPLSPVIISFFAGAAALLLKVLRNREDQEPGSTKRIEVRMRAFGRGIWIILILWVAFTAATLLAGATRFRIEGPVTVYPGGWSEPLGIGFVMDAPALVMELLIFLVASTSLLFASGKKEYGQEYGPGFFFFAWFLIASGQAVATGADLFTIFVFFEVLAVSAYILIAWKRKARAVFAAFRYLILATVSIACYLIAIYILYRHTGTLSIRLIIERGAGIPNEAAALAAGAIITGLATRMAIFPFHGWLPEAHSIAPHPVSALLSGMVIKIPLIPFIRIAPLFTGVLRLRVGTAILIMGSITALFGVILALQQRDAKRLLAYHSISQIGFIAAGFSLLFLDSGAGMAGGVGNTGAAAALFHAFNHGVFKSLLFLSVGRVCDRLGSRDLYTIRGAAGSSPGWFILYLVGAFSIAGIPLFSGYVSKSLIAEALYPYPVVWYLLLAASVGTVASFIKLGRIFLPGSKPGRKPGKPPGSNPGSPPSSGGDLLKGERKSKPAELIAATILALTAFFTGTFTKGLFLLGKMLTGTAAFKGETITYIWKGSSLAKQGMVTAGGIILYLLITTGPGKALAHRIRSIPGTSDAHIRSMTAALLILWLFFF